MTLVSIGSTPWSQEAILARIHPDDAAAWRFAFIDVEGGGKGKYHISQATSSWRTFVTWEQHRNPSIEQVPVQEELAPVRELSIASFGKLLVRYEPITAFCKEWKLKLPPGASLAIIIADAWRGRQLELFSRPGRRQRFDFRDVDESSGAFLP